MNTILLSAEDKQEAHLKAAVIRTNWAEYTAAAYHYLQADQADLAVEGWYPHRQDEVSQGQARVALSLFETIRADQLNSPNQEILSLLLNELQYHQGNYDFAWQSLRRHPF